MFLFKIIASLIGVVLTLGGFGAFVFSIFLFIGRLTYSPSGPILAGTQRAPPPDLGLAIVCCLGGAMALYLGTQLGRFARGDFD